jgi:hypothetical protein
MPMMNDGTMMSDAAQEQDGHAAGLMSGLAESAMSEMRNMNSGSSSGTHSLETSPMLRPMKSSSMRRNQSLERLADLAELCEPADHARRALLLAQSMGGGMPPQIQLSVDQQPDMKMNIKADPEAPTAAAEAATAAHPQDVKPESQSKAELGGQTSSPEEELAVAKNPETTEETTEKKETETPETDPAHAFGSMFDSGGDDATGGEPPPRETRKRAAANNESAQPKAKQAKATK